MKHSFTVILTMCILMLVGVALIPGLDISNKPRPRQGKVLTISYYWQGAAAKVVEQNVTSKIEGLVSSVGGVESVSSESYFGGGKITVQLKKKAPVSSVKFEIASLLRQVKDKLPQGVSYPDLVGGEVVTGKESEKNVCFLSYEIHSQLSDYDMKKHAERTMKSRLERIDGVHRVDIWGGTSRYMELTYRSEQLALYGLTSYDVEEAIRNYLGRLNIVGDVYRENRKGSEERISLFLAIDGGSSVLETIPVKEYGGKIIYLNNLVKCEYKTREPDRYYRINGMNTVYMNVVAEEDANIWSLSNQVKDEVEKLSGSKDKLRYDLTYDKADEEFSDFKTLIFRSGMSLLILLVFVFLCKLDWKYLFIIFTTLLANILIAVICYRLFDMRLQPFSMAGITVSLGLIIDSTIVMVDHYSYHHDFKAYFGVVGAMLTTIGALVIIFWLPDFMKEDLYDFSWMIIINLVVALIVSGLFAPALVDRMKYGSRRKGKPHYVRLMLLWNKVYRKYIALSQHFVMRWVLLAATAGMFGWSLYLFIDTLDENFYQPDRGEMQLHIGGKMPVGGTPAQLNEKVEDIEAFLTKFKEIKRFETHVERWGSTIDVKFTEAALKSGFPYVLEGKVIGKLVSIGGADWSTYGVSERGFSNSLNLQYRSCGILISGYEYERLYRFAEDMVKRLEQNARVTDVIIETPGHENQEDEFFMDYKPEMMANDCVSKIDVYRAVASMLDQHEMGQRLGTGQKTDYVLRPEEYEQFDLWQLENAYVKVAGRDMRLSDFMDIKRREAKNCIPRQNQEYVLRVAFNIQGTGNYTRKYIKGIVDEFNHRFPVGFRCVDPSAPEQPDDGTQYWLIGLVVIVIFMICSALFESLYKALVIIFLIPVSLTGMFLTYHFSGIEFGTGGFAATVMLCGLTVNAGIYMMNEYNQVRTYVKAYNHKIIPILLTIASTILGFIPFLVEADDDRFWFTFAVGSISGLVFSVFAVVFTMPLFLRAKRKVVLSRSSAEDTSKT